MAVKKIYINPNHPVYFSYAGNDDKDETLESPIEKLRELLENANIDYHDYRVNGKSNFTYRHPMVDSEEQIGRGDIIVVVFSMSYIDSPHCMYEWYNIVHNPDYEKRIFPIYLDDLRDRLNSEKRTEKLDRRMEILVDNVTTKEALRPNDLSKLDKFILKLGDDAFKNELHLLTTYYHNNSVPKLERFDYDVLLEQIKARINELTQTNYTSDSRNPVSVAATPSLPKMSIREGIVPREKEVEDLKMLLDENRLVNMIGLGGCGKSTISEYFWQKYHPDYHIVTSVVVSIDYYEDFVEKFREAVGVPYKFNDDFKQEAVKTPNYKKTYDAIIEQLESDQYKGGDGKPNLSSLMSMKLQNMSQLKTNWQSSEAVFCRGKS